MLYMKCLVHLIYSLYFTRQGSKSSPLLYLLYINGLIKELEASKLGMCMYGLNM